ncbi:MAG: phosphoglucosamine mutase [Oscillospiraceae bacterium]|jgi:phosphoglucosamine mutase|nr:phosphoglucosamine mutase [Oscillospiraceae bacterium]
MGKLFGTDGIRGTANKSLTGELAYRVGVAVASVLTHDLEHGRARVLIGKDTRLSGYMLGHALAAGLCAGGCDVTMLGVAPTPAVAYLTVYNGFDAGIVISASHNAYEDNGIKIFNSKGFKLSDELEADIERVALSYNLPLADGAEIGKMYSEHERSLTEYIEHLRTFAEPQRRRLRIAVDCANGAAYKTAETVFSPLASKLYVVHDRPNGFNINEQCGSTAPESLMREVLAQRCDIGFAFDGDADRCIVVDERGQIIDGDKIMAIIAEHMQSHGTLARDTIVATTYSNLGLSEYAAERGMRVLQASTGDRNVLELMQKEGANFGGEQSGHLIFLDDATTGDGQLAALKFLAAVAASGKTASALADKIAMYPQELVNVPLDAEVNAETLMYSAPVVDAIDAAERELGFRGRVLVRPSGTERKLRIMVEAPTSEQAVRLSSEIARAVESAISKSTGNSDSSTVLQLPAH